MVSKTLKSAVAAVVLAAGFAGSASAQESCGVVVFFANGQASANAEALAVLRDFVARNAGEPLTVVGYTDASGSAQANLALSQSRAQSVAGALQGAQIVQVAGAGEAVRPGTSGPNDPANRRVEVTNQNCVGTTVVRTTTTTGAEMGPGFAVAAGVGLLALAAAVSDGGSSGGSTGTTGN